MSAKARNTVQQQVDFWRGIDQASTGCWNWRGPVNTGGYGMIRYCGNGWSAHRLAWHLSVGEIPIGLYVLHTCDNPPCCNPLHLWLGTNLDNIRDRDKKHRGNNQHRGKTHCPQGHPYSGANLYVSPPGYRHCKTCQRARDRDGYRLGKRGQWWKKKLQSRLPEEGAQ